MKIQMLIFTTDKDYSDHLSRILAEKHPDTFVVSICSVAEKLEELLRVKNFDVALIDAELINRVDLSNIRLPLILWDGSAHVNSEIKSIKKYQRITMIISDVLENYSQVAPNYNPVSDRGRVTVVFSPSGGSGKTTIALAFSARQSLSGRSALYLSLEPFCSTTAYFGDEGKSISKVFESLFTGNLEMLLQSYAKKDALTNIMYFREPDNYDDLNELTEEYISKLVSALSANVDDVVVDLGSVINDNTKALLDIADRVLLVIDDSGSAKVKFRQFTDQHNTFEKIRPKTTLVANKGAKVNESRVDSVIELPIVQSSKWVDVYKTLSSRF